MAGLDFVYHQGGIHLPGLGLWLDPHEPRTGPEQVFVSHAHSDHIARHREIIATPPTLRFLQARLGGRRQEHAVQFGRPFPLDREGTHAQLTLLPAGHILGSAMARIEADGQSLLYTGDFKLVAGGCAEPCEPRPADILIMETTFGRPQYRFPAAGEVLRNLIRFCREAIANHEIPVLLGYSLGKSQEILRGLTDTGFSIRLHPQVERMTRLHEEFGCRFPPYALLDRPPAPGEVVIAPPGATIPTPTIPTASLCTAVLTGWALDAGSAHAYQADAAFPLSDHADFDELLEFVRRINPRQVFTLHGFAADFAATLRDLGFHAEALTPEEQLTLTLSHRTGGELLATAPATNAPDRPRPEDSPPPPRPKAAAGTFLAFIEVCEALTGSPTADDRLTTLARFLKSVPPPQAGQLVRWFQPPPQSRPRQPGRSSAPAAWLRDLLCAAAGVDRTDFHRAHLRHQEIGETAQELFARRRPAGDRLSLAEVEHLRANLRSDPRAPSTLRLLQRAFTACSPGEAKWLARLAGGDLRLGLTREQCEVAVATAFNIDPPAVRRVNLLLQDLGETAHLAQAGRLHEVVLAPFRFLPGPGRIGDAVDGAASVTQEFPRASGPDRARPAGLVAHLHKAGQKALVYAPALGDLTARLGNLVGSALALPGELILAGELVAFRGQEPAPLPELRRHLGQSATPELFDDEALTVRFWIRDLLYQDGAVCLEEPPERRRERLVSLAPFPQGLTLHPRAGDDATL